MNERDLSNRIKKRLCKEGINIEYQELSRQKVKTTKWWVNIILMKEQTLKKCTYEV